MKEELEVAKKEIVNEIDKAKIEVIKWVIASGILQIAGSILALKFLK